MDGLLALFSAMAADGTDCGAIMPQSDADDFLSGASRIPFEVTEARRRGERCVYHPANKCWVMPDGSKVDE